MPNPEAILAAIQQAQDALDQIEAAMGEPPPEEPLEPEEGAPPMPMKGKMPMPMGG